jgi:hypothetical protein
MSKCLIVAALAGCSPTEPIDRDRLIRAFAQVESSGLNRIRYLDCIKKHLHTKNCDAWGLFGFHLIRYGVCSGWLWQWGVAPLDEQRRVMRRAIERYLSSCPKDADPLTWCANFHNAGHGSKRATPYSRKLLKAYQAAQN